MCVFRQPHFLSGLSASNVEDPISLSFGYSLRELLSEMQTVLKLLSLSS